MRPWIKHLGWQQKHRVKIFFSRRQQAACEGIANKSGTEIGRKHWGGEAPSLPLFPQIEAPCVPLQDCLWTGWPILSTQTAFIHSSSTWTRCYASHRPHLCSGNASLSVFLQLALSPEFTHHPLSPPPEFCVSSEASFSMKFSFRNYSRFPGLP